MIDQPLIVFSHGNSFPASTYNVMLNDLRRRGYRVEAIEKFGHDPRFPVSDNWPNLVDQLCEFVKPLAQQQPLYLVGHSLGGVLSLMAAAKLKDLVQGVVLLDSPVVGGWRALTLYWHKRVAWSEMFNPASISKNRRNQWQSHAHALEHFMQKRAFAKWNTQVLMDYVAHGTHDVVTEQETQRWLSFDRDIETAIYKTLPDNLERFFKQHPLACKVSFIGGLQSLEIKQAGMAFTRRLTQERIAMLDGTHLFPMEKPIMAAAAIEAALLNLAQD
jgi:pimeloyl-ACP methyl ester carboxylesterase